MTGPSSSLYSSAAFLVVGWLVARLFRRRALISIGKARRASNLSRETSNLGRHWAPELNITSPLKGDGAVIWRAGERAFLTADSALSTSSDFPQRTLRPGSA